MDSTVWIMVGVAFVTLFLIGAATSLDTERQRARRRELAGQRRLLHEQHRGQSAAASQWDDDD